MESWHDLHRDASRLRVEGRAEEAVDAYKRLLAVNPNLPSAWYNLGWLQRQTRQFKDSIDSYSRALALGVGEPEEVHLNRAVIYSDHLHKPVDAERELRAALRKNPSYVPALLNLGNLREDLGDREKARAAYEKVLSIEPQHSLALARLAGTSHSSELDNSLAHRLRAAIARPTTTAAEKADLGFALGGLLDAAGCYDDAFEAAAAANWASRTATGARYDRAAHERFVQRLVATFDRPTTPPNSGQAPAVFICGMFRSGSTLVEQILAGHSRITGHGELDLVPALVSRIADYPEAVSRANAATIADWRAFYVDGLPPQLSACHMATDKRPDNFLHIGLIKTLFPDAKIVHTRRNPLDNLLSLYFLHLDSSMAYALDLEDTAHWYRQYQHLMEHWKTLFPDDILDVDYDELVREPQQSIERMLSFLGLEWEGELLDFDRREAVVKTASVWQVRQPLHMNSSGRWRNYQRQLGAAVRMFTGPGD